MPTRQTTEAVEKSTYILQAAFTDEDGDAVIPDTNPTWTLTNENGTVINSRNGVSIAAASTINIVLSGNDLALEDQSRKFEIRILTVEATYDSSLGSNLPLKESTKFNVLNLKKVT